MVIFFRSIDTTRSRSRCPAESENANMTFFSGRNEAISVARTLFPTKTMFFTLLARRVSVTAQT